MKKNLDSLYNDEVDKLLFDYLEGSLNDVVAAELEDKLIYDSNLQEELKYWQDAYIKQDFYDNTFIEDKLKEANEVSKKVSKENYFIIIITIASLLSFMPFNIDKVQPNRNGQVPLELLASEAASEVEKLEPINHILAADDAFPESVIKGEREIISGIGATKPNDKVRSYYEIEFIKPISIKNLRSEAVYYFEKQIFLSPSKGKIEKQQVLNVFIISKKEQRAIEKAKEKALQKRIEEKFMRGGKPYVVPLNPNF